MSIFSYKDFRSYLRATISASPKKGRGQIDKIAAHLGVHQSFFSQVLAGKKAITEEQGIELSRYFNLTNTETEYLVTLIQMDRTNHPSLVEMAEQRLIRLRRQLVNNPENAALSETDRTIFYSNWIYSTIRLLTANPQFATPEKIAVRVGIAVAEVKAILEFLVDLGLCALKDGAFTIGKRRTLISRDSPTLSRHHLNWRLKAIEHIQKNPHIPICYTSPMIISETDGQKIRELLLETIRRVDSLVDPSPSEKLFCLNVDLFEF